MLGKVRSLEEKVISADSCQYKSGGEPSLAYYKASRVAPISVQHISGETANVYWGARLLASQSHIMWEVKSHLIKNLTAWEQRSQRTSCGASLEITSSTRPTKRSPNWARRARPRSYAAICTRSRYGARFTRV